MPAVPWGKCGDDDGKCIHRVDLDKRELQFLLYHPVRKRKVVTKEMLVCFLIVLEVSRVNFAPESFYPLATPCALCSGMWAAPFTSPCLSFSCDSPPHHRPFFP